MEIERKRGGAFLNEIFVIKGNINCTEVQSKNKRKII
jgi:hypothetical protein